MSLSMVTENGNLTQCSSELNGTKLAAASESPCKNKYGVIFGDSNARDLTISKQLPVEVINMSTGGTKVEDVKDKISNLNVDRNNVKVVLLHVGTCNWRSVTDSDGDVETADAVYNEYVETLENIGNAYPNAELVLSSVPLRDKEKNSETNDKINAQVSALNDRLSHLSRREQNVTFINNDNTLAIFGEPCSDCYNEKDMLGVHLNTKGRAFLAENFNEAISEGYFKALLRDNFNVVPSRLSSTP